MNPAENSMIGIYLNDHLAGAAYKVGAAWIGEKAGRLKAAGWRTLRARADTDARLDADLTAGAPPPHDDQPGDHHDPGNRG